MKGKTVVILTILISIIALILIYVWLQNVITKYDIDRALSAVHEKVHAYKDVYKIS